MSSPSPTSSPARSRNTVLARSTGPPRRTYARKRSTVASIRDEGLSSDTDGTSSSAHGAKEERKSVGRITQGRAVAGTMSSPVTLSSEGASYSSRLRSSKSSPDVGKSTSGTPLTTGSKQESSKGGTLNRLSRSARPNGIESSKRHRVSSPESSSGSPSPSPRKRPNVESGLSRSAARSDASSKNSRLRDPTTPPRDLPQQAPSTPTASSSRDFAHLFAAVSPGSTLASPGRNRLLEKSHSSGRVLDSPSKLRQRFGRIQDEDDSGPTTPKSAFGRTQSWPESPSRPHHEITEPDPSALWVKPVEAPVSGGRAKRTYGRTRTIVAEDTDTVSDVDKLEAALAKESYTSVRNRYEVNPVATEYVSTAVPDMLLARAPQSVTDMRSKGENRRFMDETGYLLDGIEDHNAPKGFKRSSCVDILENMQDEIWMSKMKICGQTERVWDAFNGVRANNDIVMDAVCLLALHFMIEQDSGVEGILRSDAAGCTRLLISSMSERNGVLDATAQQMPLRSREHATLARELVKLMSTRALASSILSRLCHLIETASLVSERVLSKTVNMVKPEVRSLSDRSELYEAGLPFAPNDGRFDPDHICYCLSIIENTMIPSSQERDLLARQDELPSMLVQVLVCCNVICLEKTGASRNAALAITSTLKIFANLINIDSDCSRHLLQVKGSLIALARIVNHRETVSRFMTCGDEPVDTEAAANEILCLVLAILTSGVLSRTGLIPMIAALVIDPTCTGRSTCLHICRCGNIKPFVQELARLYTTFRSSETPESSVIAAYLALLLSIIMVGDLDSLNAISGSLPGGSRAAKLDNVLRSLRELNGYRSDLHQGLQEMRGEAPDEDQTRANEVQQAIDDLSRLAETCRNDNC